MLLIVVLGLIAKLALVSSDCDIGTQKLNDFDWNKFVYPRPWYWRLHIPCEIENNLDCPVITFSVPEGNSTSVTMQAFDIRKHRPVKFTGHAFNWNNTGYDFELDQQPILKGRHYVIAVDYDRYFIIKLCSQESNKVRVYVAFRNIYPDKATLDDVEKDFKDNDIDGSQLMPGTAFYCQQ